MVTLLCTLRFISGKRYRCVASAPARGLSEQIPSDVSSCQMYVPVTGEAAAAEGKQKGVAASCRPRATGPSWRGGLCLGTAARPLLGSARVGHTSQFCLSHSNPISVTRSQIVGRHPTCRVSVKQTVLGAVRSQKARRYGPKGMFRKKRGK